MKHCVVLLLLFCRFTLQCAICFVTVSLLLHALCFCTLVLHSICKGVVMAGNAATAVLIVAKIPLRMRNVQQHHATPSVDGINIANAKTRLVKHLVNLTSPDRSLAAPHPASQC